MLQRLSVALLLTLIPVAAYAHPGHFGRAGFTSGFNHPLSGWDHLLATIMLGLIAYRIGSGMRWRLPLSYITGTVMGGLLAALGVTILPVEIGIASSLIFLGGFAAVRPSLPNWIILVASALFAGFHGYAHVDEMQSAGTLAPYFAGFLLATAFLNVVGLGLGLAMDRLWPRRALAFAQIFGSATCVAGVALLTGMP